MTMASFAPRTSQKPPDSQLPLKSDSKAENWRSALSCSVLKNDQWQRIAPLLPGKAGDPGRSAANNRLFLEAVLWMARTGAPWRDLPEAFGAYQTVKRRYYDWVARDVLGSSSRP